MKQQLEQSLCYVRFEATTKKNPFSLWFYRFACENKWFRNGAKSGKAKCSVSHVARANVQMNCVYIAKMTRFFIGFGNRIVTIAGVATN